METERVHAAGIQDGAGPSNLCPVSHGDAKGSVPSVFYFGHGASVESGTDERNAVVTMVSLPTLLLNNVGGFSTTADFSTNTAPGTGDN
ncbi:hypothetical protein UY3_09511 [Chelonia mydas]|uniref:Uncharacterized protein n=1 Tax=Chelonia mydas TaxID=8469 RepID=M7BZ39_CHEMY|nr:hypothetical protein UY3_09511 [Chelonia mydas]